MKDPITSTLKQNKYLFQLFQDKKLILTTTGLFMLLAGLDLVTFYQPTYKSHASVLIKDVSPGTFVADLGSDEQLKAASTNGNPILTQSEILKSDRLASYIVGYIQQKYPHRYDDLKEADISKVFTIKNHLGTDILFLTFTWDDPRRAQEFLNVMLTEYNNINLGINRSIRSVRRQYIDEKVIEVRERLQSIRESIKNYKKQTLAINLYDQSKDLVQQKTDFSSQYENTQAAIASIEGSIRELEHQLALNPQQALSAVALGSNNKNLTELRTQLNEAQQQLALDSVKLADTNPKMVALKQKINTIQDQINAHVNLTLGKKAPSSIIFDPVRENLVQDLVSSAAKLKSLNAQKASLLGSMGRIDTQQSTLPVQKFVLDALEQEEKAFSDAYDELLKKQLEARIKEAEVVSNVYPIDSPSYPLKGSFPTPLHLALLALFLGSITGSALSLLRHRLKGRCEGLEAVEAVTGKPVIGSKPWISEGSMTPETQMLLEGSYHKMATNLLVQANKQHASVLAMTSSSLQKSHSNTTYALAKAFKSLGHSVLVIDADLRIPTLYKNTEIGAQLKTNLSHLLLNLNHASFNTGVTEKEEILSTLVQDDMGIYVLANQFNVEDPYDYFASQGFSRIITTLKSEFDWIFIETPPVSVATETLMIARQSDSVVILTDREVTQAGLRKLTETFEAADISVLGSIIRQVDLDLEREFSEYQKHLLEQGDWHDLEESDHTPSYAGI